MSIDVFQAKLWKLEDLRIASSSESGACGITSAHISEAIACMSPPCAATAEQFTGFMWNLAVFAKGPGCATIFEAPAIPVIFDCLRAWPHEERIVRNSCGAIYSLAAYGNAAIQQALRDVPDCEALLRAARESGYDVYNDDSKAALALRKLGMYVRVLVCCYLI